jgi:hypothetical protein
MLVAAIGVFIAFIFTIFPYPITSGDILRQDTARELYLLSKMYGLTQARLHLVIELDGANKYDALRAAIDKVGFKIVAIQARNMENLGFTSWELRVSSRFPTDIYRQLLASMQRFSTSLSG